MSASKNIISKKQGIVMRNGWGSLPWKQFFLCVAAARAWQRCRALLPFGGYRPERHYMRGPGPKTLSRQSSPAGDHEA
jgi:hypothetical protein